MSEAPQPPPEYVVKKTQHQTREEYIHERGNEFSTLSAFDALLVDKNNKRLVGAALTSKRASLLREMEYGENAPTFAKILEQKKAKCEEAISQELERKQIVDADEADAISKAFSRSAHERSRLEGLKNKVVSVAIFLSVAFGFKGSMNANNVEIDNSPTQQPTTSIEPAPISQQTEMSLAGYASPLPSSVVEINTMKQKPGGEVSVPETEPKLTPQENVDATPRQKESQLTESKAQQEDMQDLTEKTYGLVDESNKEQMPKYDPQINMPIGKEYPLSRDFVPPLVSLVDYGVRVAPENVHDDEGKGQPAATEALVNLFNAADKEGIKDLFVKSGYRSWQTQEHVYNGNVMRFGPEQQMSAAPGETEHSSGVAFDLTTATIDYATNITAGFENTPAGKWLLDNDGANLAKHGFVLTYPADGLVDGRPKETWHIRFVGKAIANNLRKQHYISDPRPGVDIVRQLKSEHERLQKLASNQGVERVVPEG